LKLVRITKKKKSIRRESERQASFDVTSGGKREQVTPTEVEEKKKSLTGKEEAWEKGRGEPQGNSCRVKKLRKKKRSLRACGNLQKKKKGSGALKRKGNVKF